MHATSHVVARNASPVNTALYKRVVSTPNDPNTGPDYSSIVKRSGTDVDPNDPGVIFKPPGRFARRLFGRDKAISARDDLSSETRDVLERDGLVDDI